MMLVVEVIFGLFSDTSTIMTSGSLRPGVLLYTTRLDDLVEVVTTSVHGVSMLTSYFAVVCLSGSGCKGQVQED